MVRPEEVKSAADELLAAALLGGGWEGALQKLADATEAGGASLVLVQAGREAAHLSSLDWADSEALAIAGGAPPSPLRFYPGHVFATGFRADQDVWTDGELRRDPYYQEFLRPRGVFFHAKARLWCAPSERITLTLKRRIEHGPYEPADIAALDAIVSELRAVFRIARSVLDAEASGSVRVLAHSGTPVIELDAAGRILRVHGDPAKLSGLDVANRRLVATDRLAQRRLDRAVAETVKAPRRPALVRVSDPSGGRHFLQLVPVTGEARDVFLATTAIAMLIDPSSPPADVGLFSDEIRNAFGLTVRELQIAILLAEGLSLLQIAGRLRLGIGTARNHLKSIFAKTGTTRQGEMIALLWKVRP